jgi:hypothetical protein
MVSKQLPEGLKKNDVAIAHGRLHMRVTNLT